MSNTTTRRRFGIVLIIGAILALFASAFSGTAQASPTFLPSHVPGPTGPSASCTTLGQDFTGFPDATADAPNVITFHVEGVPATSSDSFTGTSGSVSAAWPAGSNVAAGGTLKWFTTWTADGGGRSPADASAFNSFDASSCVPPPPPPPPPPPALPTVAASYTATCDTVTAKVTNTGTVPVGVVIIGYLNDGTTVTSSGTLNVAVGANVTFQFTKTIDVFNVFDATDLEGPGLINGPVVVTYGDCPAPATTTTTTTVVPTVTTAPPFVPPTGTPTLPNTGFPAELVALAALAILLIGLKLVMVNHNRPTVHVDHQD